MLMRIPASQVHRAAVVAAATAATAAAATAAATAAVAAMDAWQIQETCKSTLSDSRAVFSLGKLTS
eukprot:1138600-Pelagomonas_calceolata.AAC.10